MRSMACVCVCAHACGRVPTAPLSVFERRSFWHLNLEDEASLCDCQHLSAERADGWACEASSVQEKHGATACGAGSAIGFAGVVVTVLRKVIR